MRDPCHSLQVHLRVPVRVKEDARVRRLAIDAKSARARAHQEDETRRARHVERVDVDGALHAVGGAVEAAVLVALVRQKVLEQVEGARELRQHKHAGTGLERKGPRGGGQRVHARRAATTTVPR